MKTMYQKPQIQVRHIEMNDLMETSGSGLQQATAGSGGSVTVDTGTSENNITTAESKQFSVWESEDIWQ